ncbi:MAG: S66 peptidase family protein [Planctomycetota bacterium]
MPNRVPLRLQRGDIVRVIAPSRSTGCLKAWSGFADADFDFAVRRLEDLGLTVTWGSGAIQLLEGTDYDLIANNPKIVVGYSDIGYTLLANLSRAGVVGYYGPNLSSFAMRRGFAYTNQHFLRCLFDSEPIELHPSGRWSDDNWIDDQDNRTFFPNHGYWNIVEGEAEGMLIGGSTFCLNMLWGTRFAPDLEDSIVFLESSGHGKASRMALDSDLRVLAMQSGFDGVRGIVLGRYPKRARIDRADLTSVIRSIPALQGLPVLANVDFGHTTPAVTLPIGGRCVLRVGSVGPAITLTVH